MNPTIVKYREAVTARRGSLILVDIADLAALLDIADEAQTLIDLERDGKKARFIANDTDRNREISRVAHEMQVSKHEIIAALARLNGDKA